MTIEQIETFLIITETNSITAAAKRLFISQSTVSHRINALEKELGFSLLSRTRGERFINLTLKGEEFIEIAKRWKTLWSETNLWKAQESKMNLKIASVDSINTSVLLNFYKKILMEEEGISIDISSHWSKTIYELIENYDLDIGYVLAPLKYPNVQVKPLFSARGVVVSLKTSQYSEKLHPKELNLSEEILFSSMPSYEIWRNIWWEKHEKKSLSVDTITLLFSMLISDKQWAIVPVWVAKAFENKYPIKISELSVIPPEYSCYKIVNKHPRPSKLKALEIISESLDEFLRSEIFLELLK